MGCQPWHPALFQNSGLPSVGSLLEAPVIWYEFERMPLPGQYRGLTGDQRAYGEGHLPLRPQTVSAECQATKTPQSFLPASAATWREWLGAIGSCCSWPLPLLPLLSQVGRIKGRAHGGGAAAAGLKSECAREGGGGGQQERHKVGQWAQPPSWAEVPSPGTPGSLWGTAFPTLHFLQLWTPLSPNVSCFCVPSRLIRRTPRAMARWLGLSSCFRSN